jgi:hypothetical protein
VGRGGVKELVLQLGKVFHRLQFNSPANFGLVWF